jgi:hypothetical protein
MPQQTTSPIHWQRILVASQDTSHLIAALKDIYQAHEYKPYDPFPGGTGTPVRLADKVRLFVCPPAGGWLRVCVAPEDTVSPAILGQIAQTTSATLIDSHLQSTEQFDITVYGADAKAQPGPDGLLPYLKPDLPPDTLAVVWQQDFAAVESAPTSDLPDEIQQLARDKGVSMKHVDKLMQRVSRRVFGQMESQEGQDAQSAARDALKAGAEGINWGSAAGQHLLAVMECLTVPADWHLPDWKTLSGAYQLARQRQRAPGGLTLPGDEDLLAALPDALTYTPLYFGQKKSS